MLPTISSPRWKTLFIQFSKLAKLPKPVKGCLAQKQMVEVRQWASLHGKSVRQNTTQNFSTKDKPGTLPLNVYQTWPPKEEAVNFNTLLQDVNGAQDKEIESSNRGRKIIHSQGTYVVYPHSRRPRDLPTSSFYIVRLLEDLPEDDHVAHVRTEWYTQDLFDPLLFTTTGKEHVVSKDGISETITSIKSVADDTIEIKENDYYVLLASLRSSEDTALPQEETELTANGDLSEDNEVTDNQSSRPKRRSGSIYWLSFLLRFCEYKVTLS